MIGFRVMIIDYLSDGSLDSDFDLMKHKAKILKKSLVDGPLVIFDNQINIEPNLVRGYYIVTIDEIPNSYMKKVFKKCKEIKPYKIEMTWYNNA